MPLTEEERKKLAELQKKYDAFYKAATAAGMADQAAKVDAMLKMGTDAEQYQALYETSVRDQEEEQETKTERPEPVKINETVQVWSEEDSDFYTARWNIFSVGVDNRVAPIDISAAGTYVIIPSSMGWKIRITSITFTVSDECNITLTSSQGNISGAMDFGGENEPRGMAGALGGGFIDTGIGEQILITVDSDVHVGGFMTYVYW
jgi:hypothetical protein